MTLGYICEEIHPDDIDTQTKNSIVVALSNNIKGTLENDADFEACKLAIKAMVFSIPYSSQNFKVEGERNFIMEKLFGACQHQNEEIVENALTCLREITT